MLRYKNNLKQKQNENIFISKLKKALPLWELVITTKTTKLTTTKTGTAAKIQVSVYLLARIRLKNSKKLLTNETN